VAGLLAGLPRKNCWTIAEHAGEASPDGMRHLLTRAAWDADGVRDDLRGSVVEHLGDPDAVLVVDEAGGLERGTATVGYSGSTRQVTWRGDRGYSASRSGLTASPLGVGSSGCLGSW
jgi:SRSO17 transposase